MSSEYGKAQNHQHGLKHNISVQWAFQGQLDFIKMKDSHFFVQKTSYVHLLERIHSQSNVHAWAVGQESCQSSFLKQTKDEDFVSMKEKW